MARTKKAAEAVVETVKEAAAVAPAAEEVKAETPAKKTAAKTTKTAKAPAKKAAAKTTKAAEAKTAKAPAKKTAAKKAAAAVENVYIQQNGNEVTAAYLVEKAKVDAGVKTPKSVDVYVRPEINMVYYVIDGETFGNFELC